jgi:hypothetical protein
MTDYPSLITSEHCNQPKYMAWIGVLSQAMQDMVAAAQQIAASFDVDTAVGQQLDIIGLWVGQPRVVPNVLTVPYFGFSEHSTGLADGDQFPFGELTDPSKGAPFYNLGDPIGTTSVLNDAQYRTILYAAIVRNQFNGTLPELEQALFDIFDCPCTVTDTGDKSISITVSEPQSLVVQALVANYDILPRPAGVKIGSITYPS